MSRHMWKESRGLSLAAAVFAIEAFLHSADADVEVCSECRQALEAERCPVCGTPRHRVTTRFRDFVSEYADVTELRRGFIDGLYDARSGIVH